MTRDSSRSSRSSCCRLWSHFDEHRWKERWQRFSLSFRRSLCYSQFCFDVLGAIWSNRNHHRWRDYFLLRRCEIIDAILRTRRKTSFRSKRKTKVDLRRAPERIPIDERCACKWEIVEDNRRIAFHSSCNVSYRQFSDNVLSMYPLWVLATGMNEGEKFDRRTNERSVVYRKRTPKEIHEHVTQRFQIVATTLFSTCRNAKIRNKFRATTNPNACWSTCIAPCLKRTKFLSRREVQRTDFGPVKLLCSR